ncbi:MAG: hypothetical protein ACPGUF_04190 [Litorivicinus sp.]
MTLFFTPIAFAVLNTALAAALWRLLNARRVAMILLIALWVNGALTMSQRLWPDLGPLLAQYTTSTFFIGYLAWTLAILWLALNVQLRSGVFQWAFWAVWLFAAAAITTESMGLVYAGWFSDTIQKVCCSL